VKYRTRPQHPQRVVHLTAVENVDALPPGERRELRRRLRSRPAHEIGGTGELLEKVTAGESGRAGDEDDRVSHALWLAAEQAEEVGKRSKARQHERKVQTSIARDR